MTSIKSNTMHQSKNTKTKTNRYHNCFEVCKLSRRLARHKDLGFSPTTTHSHTYTKHNPDFYWCCAELTTFLCSYFSLKLPHHTKEKKWTGARQDGSSDKGTRHLSAPSRTHKEEAECVWVTLKYTFQLKQTLQTIWIKEDSRDTSEHETSSWGL